MSEQNTSEPNVIAPGPKVKNPKRVAAGKRLGAISKQAKEPKRLERESQQTAEMDSAYAREETGNENTLYLVCGLLAVGAASYLLFLNKEKVVRTLTGDKKESDPVPEQEPTPKKENSKSIFDD